MERHWLYRTQIKLLSRTCLQYHYSYKNHTRTHRGGHPVSQYPECDYAELLRILHSSFLPLCVTIVLAFYA